MNRNLLLAGALAATALHVAADEGAHTLAPYEAVYSVRIKGLGGTMTQSLQAHEDGLLARSTLTPRGLAAVVAGGELQETSLFSVLDGALRSQRYTLVDTIGRNDDQGEMTFDWDAGTASGSLNDSTFEHQLDDRTVDRLALQYALMLDLLHGRINPAYTLLDKDQRKDAVIRHLGNKTIDVPAGRYTVSEVHHQKAGSSRRVVLYLASELGYLPVRIEQFKNDTRQVRAELKTYGTPGS
ncbi:MAG: DUF3108 domain-containing protein [Pseudomonadota bacterium]